MTDTKKVAEKMPKIYSDESYPLINMHSSMITTKTAFIKLWKGSTVKCDMDAAWDRAEAWKASFK